MKSFINNSDKKYSKKGVIFALIISIIWSLLSWLGFYIIDKSVLTLLNFESLRYLIYVTDFIKTQIFLSPVYIESIFYSVFKPWILIRFLVFAIFGYYNGLLYKKILSKFKYTILYFIMTSLIFYYFLLALLQLLGLILYGGLP